MSNYTVHMTTTAFLSIEVDVDEEAVRAQLVGAGEDPDNSEVLAEAMKEAAIEEAYQEAPGSLCAQCSGYGRDYGLDLGEWEPSEDSPVDVAG